jgi:DNA-binding GntR family transcriptional regulator
MRRLQSEGLVNSDVHRGATVAEAEQGAAEENIQIRSALEAVAAPLAAQRVTGEVMEELWVLHEGMASASPDADYGDLNRKFHFRFDECARSPLQLTLMRLLWQSIPRGPRVVRPMPESRHQHAQLLKALAAHDSEAAADQMRAHILDAPPW